MTIAETDTGQGQTLLLERRLAADPARVWRAFTDPTVFARWWGPQGSNVPALEMDCRVGGAYRVEMLAESGYRNVLTGTYRAVDPPHRLVFSWIWEADSLAGVEMEVEVTLAPDGAGTRLLIEHRGLPTDTARDKHAGGWGGCLDSLEAELS